MQFELENIFFRFLDWSIESPQILDWLSDVAQLLNQKNLIKKNNEFKHWQNLLNASNGFGLAQSIDLNSPRVNLKNTSLNQEQKEALKTILLKFSPWRKGPFEFFGVHIDSEWQSNLKWDRLEPHLNLKDKKVLDVGCSNGYYAWRALGLDASLVIGIDPSILFFSQFLLIKNALPKELFLANSDSIFPIKQRIFNLPMALEAMPSDFALFDTVFSMGVLYHRQSPIEHLNLLFKKLKNGGELFLETLIIDGDATNVLVPEGNYAGMSNIWFLPSSKALELWLKKVGFSDIKILDLSYTSLEEQRSTEFMQSQSLKDFLSEDQKTTKENLPPPQRILISCKK